MQLSSKVYCHYSAVYPAIQCVTFYINPFNASCSKLQLFKGSSAIMV